MTSPDPQLEMMLQKAARDFPYPPTPDLTARVMQQHKKQSRRSGVNTRLLQIAAALLIGLMILFTFVPEIRAAVLEFLRIGAISIREEQLDSPTLSTAHMDALDYPGSTTLDAARESFGAPIALPTIPDDLGAPSRVYAFDQMVVLVWLDDQQQIRLELHIIPSRLVATKYYPYHPVEVTVDGDYAVWLTDVHEYEFFGEAVTLERTVTGNVLIWERGNITYRMVTEQSLDEAIQTAESFR